MEIHAHKQNEFFATREEAETCFASHYGQPGFLANAYAVRWGDYDLFAVNSYWKEGTKPNWPLFRVPVGLQSAAIKALARSAAQ